MMSPSLKSAFSELMLEGINITRKAQEGDALYAEKGVLNEVFEQYQVWRSKIKDFLAEAGLNSLEWYKFYESDSVPLFKGGIEYGDVRSEQSQQLLKNIRIETSAKLELLKRAGDALFGKKLPPVAIENPDKIKIKGKRHSFSFNIQTGTAVLNKTTQNFPPGQQKFEIIKSLITANEHHAEYDMLCDATRIKKGKPGHRDIQGLIKEIKSDLGILPAGRKSNPDIFKNIPRVGYRLSVG